MVIINGGTSARDVTIPGVTSGAFTIPAALGNGADPLITGRANLERHAPACSTSRRRTTAVFEQPQASRRRCPATRKPHP